MSDDEIEIMNTLIADMSEALVSIMPVTGADVSDDRGDDPVRIVKRAGGMVAYCRRLRDEVAELRSNYDEALTEIGRLTALEPAERLAEQHDTDILRRALGLRQQANRAAEVAAREEYFWTVTKSVGLTHVELSPERTYAYARNSSGLPVVIREWGNPEPAIWLSDVYDGPPLEYRVHGGRVWRRVEPDRNRRGFQRVRDWRLAEEADKE